MICIPLLPALSRVASDAVGLSHSQTGRTHRGSSHKRKQKWESAKIRNGWETFPSQVPPSCCKSPSLDCGVSSCLFVEYVFCLGNDQMSCKNHRLGFKDIEFWISIDQVRLHPSNIHYSGCAHSLADKLSTHLKLVSWLAPTYVIKPSTNLVSIVFCLVHLRWFSFLADLCCGWAFGGFTSHWIISLNQTQTDSSNALKPCYQMLSARPNKKPNSFMMIIYSLRTSLINVWFICFI